MFTACLLIVFVALARGADPLGTVLLAGGEVDDNNTAIYGGMIAAAGGADAHVAIITAASDDGCCDVNSSWVIYKKIFESYSPQSVTWIPIDVNHTLNNHNPEVLANISRSTLFFFSGGDQVSDILSISFQGASYCFIFQCRPC